MTYANNLDPDEAPQKKWMIKLPSMQRVNNVQLSSTW